MSYDRRPKVEELAGKVYLIGAGPGDPGLLTVKGREALERADVVVYDRLAHPSLLDYAPASAERIFAGKARGQQELTQDGINALLVEKAQAGLRVARLKGGDPFVFGRGGEEALELARNGVPFEVVPGVSSAIAAPAYAGIPVTHRGIATGFTVVSGSEDPSKPESAVRWQELARSLAAQGGTLMTLMGWASIEKILEALQQAGLSAETPVALVQWGTWSRQRTVTGTLADAAGKGRAAGLAAPVVAVVGEVVSLRDELAWFDNRPLFGKRVLVTRSRTQASRMCELLEDAGAEAVELPAIAIAPPEDFAPLDRAVGRLSEYGWVVFASVNAVEFVFDRLDSMGGDARAFGKARVGAIGPATASALKRRGIRPDFTPSRSVSSAALEELAGYEWNGVSVLLPAADIGRDELAEGLSRLGADVERVTAYRTITPPDAAQQARDALTGGIDIVTFTSSSTVRNLLALLEEDGPTFSSLPLDGNTRGGALSGSLIACIGPVTAGTARELGLRVDIEAEEHTVDGLAEALIKHFSAGKSANPENHPII